MTVEVKSGELLGYAGLLDRNAGYADEILGYVKTWAGEEMKATNAEGLLTDALNIHDKAYAQSVEVLTKVGTVLRGSAIELRGAAKRYSDADQKERERLDKLSAELGGGVVARVGWEATASGYKDLREPAGWIKVEPSVIEVREWIDKVLNGITDATSISGLVFRVIEELTGRKPVDELVQFLTGDWKAYSRCADVWGSVAGMLEDIAYNVDYGNASMDHGWSGRASELAYKYFADMADSLMQLSAKFKEMEEAYTAFAQWVMQISTILADLIKLAIDTALVILTRKKGWGIPILSEAMGTFEAVKIVKFIAKFGWTLVAARSTVASRFAKLAFVDHNMFGISPALNTNAYDMAGV